MRHRRSLERGRPPLLPRPTAPRRRSTRVIHYLWMIAVLLRGGAHKEAEKWINHILVQLLTRHPLDVIATIRQTATNRHLSVADRTAVDAAIDYLNKNSLYIHYAHFLK